MGDSVRMAQLESSILVGAIDALGRSISRPWNICVVASACRAMASDPLVEYKGSLSPLQRACWPSSTSLCGLGIFRYPYDGEPRDPGAPDRARKRYGPAQGPPKELRCADRPGPAMQKRPSPPSL